MKLSSSSKLGDNSTSAWRTTSSEVNLAIDLNIDSRTNIFQALSGVLIADGSRQGTSGVTVKMLIDGVLPVSAGLEDIRIVLILPITSQAVASCLLMVPVLSRSDLSSSLVFLAVNADLAAGEITVTTVLLHPLHRLTCIHFIAFIVISIPNWDYNLNFTNHHTSLSHVTLTTLNYSIQKRKRISQIFSL